MSESKKRPLSENSTFSDLELSFNKSSDKLKDKQSTPVIKKEKKKGKSKNKKVKLDPEMASSLEKKIEEINAKLSDMLTKKTKALLKVFWQILLKSWKTKIIGSVLLRVEKLEGDVHETIIGQSKLKKEIEECKTKNTALQDENTKLKNEIKSETESRKEQINSLEQYGRRNNIRVSGLDFDNKYDDAHATSSGIITLFNDKMGLVIFAINGP